jgi:hypothetical protein
MRLTALRKELEIGQAEPDKVERQRTYLRETMLRINGAIRVLEELLAEKQPTRQNGADPSKTQPATAQADEVNL